MALTTRSDPTRTTSLRRSFHRDLRRRLLLVAKDIVQLVLTEDAFGLKAPPKLRLLAEREFAFQTDDSKLRSFRRWLTQKVNQRVLTTDATGKPWTGKYVESAYKKGQLRAFMDARKGKFLGKKPDFFEGSKEEFLRSSFDRPERLSKVQLLATRAFDELEGITSTMGTKLNRILSSGLIEGKNPRQIAKEMVAQISGLSKGRAMAIARTEIIHAHAEGQLDSFEDMGMDDVAVMAEWSTAGDDEVCPLCQDREGKVYTIAEARGLIPLHPNCRCAWIPAEEPRPKRRRRR